MDPVETEFWIEFWGRDDSGAPSQSAGLPPRLQRLMVHAVQPTAIDGELLMAQRTKSAQCWREPTVCD